MFKSIRNTLAFALLAVVGALALPASATTFSGGLSGWKADASGNASSVSTGGSMSETSAQGNGYAANATVNATGGQAQAWGGYNHQGVNVGTNQSSFSNGQSGSVKYGNATSQTAGGQGTDVNSGAWGSFKSGGYGGWLGFGH